MAEAAKATLQNLEWRLKRLEHFLSFTLKEQNVDSTSGQDLAPDQDAVDVRLKSLESRIQQLVHSNHIANALVNLYDQYPELNAPKRSQEEFDNVLATRLPIVLASATTYATTVSQLNNLQQYPLPETKELIALLSQSSRLERLEAVQQQQLADIAQLRQRSTSLVAEWYQSQLLDSSERWSSWEDRLMYAEQTVRRQEAAKAREENGV